MQLIPSVLFVTFNDLCKIYFIAMHHDSMLQNNLQEITEILEGDKRQNVIVFTTVVEGSLRLEI